MIVVAPIATAGQENLLANGHLETADPDQRDRPRDFRPGRIGKSYAEMTWTSPGYKSHRCIAITTKDSSGLGYWQTLVTVTPETTYTISLDYKVGQDRTAPTSVNPLYNRQRPGGPNLELGLLPDTPAKAGRPTAWSDIGIALHPVGGIYLPPATKWSRFTHSLRTRKGQTKLILKLRLCNYAQKVWFDNLSLVKGTSPETAFPADPIWVQRDTTPPAVFGPSPVPNSNAKKDATIGIRFRDSGTGVDVSGTRVLLDGVDVTSRAKITPTGMTLIPDRPMAPGAHRVQVSTVDNTGNRGNAASWQFGVDRTLNNRLVTGKEGTRLNGEPFFPIGIYSYSCHPGDGRFREDHLRQAADAGFNIVLNTIETRQGLDRELATGIMGTLNISAGLKNCTDPVAARKALLETGQGRFAEHPCVIAFWADDPENVEDSRGTAISKTAIAKMRNARKVLKKQYPGTPSIFAISNLPRLKPAMPYGDILLSYRYAVPQYHPMMINGYTIATCRQLVPDKPLWFLSQAVDLGYGARFKLPRPMRPTPAEVDAMAFYSLVCGINGYALYANYINARDFPEHWATALDIANRVRHIAGPLNVGRDVRSARLKRSPLAGSVFFRELVLNGRHTLIAVNMSAVTVPATWEFEKPVRAAVLFEDRLMKTASKSIPDVFTSWAVHIYQW